MRRCLLPICLTILSPAAMSQAPATAAKRTEIAAAAPTTITGSTTLAAGPYGTNVNVNDLQSELQRVPEATRQALMIRPESIGQIVNNLLVRRVLAKEAERDGLNKDALVAASLVIASDRVLSDARLARLDAQNAPSDAAVEAYARSLYQANPTKFDQPAQTRARHILIANAGPASLEKARELLAKLRAGANFEELAKANSADAGSAARGGDLGFFGAGKMVRPFEDAVNKLAKPGDLSEPVETQFGYHIIRLEERREKGRQPFEEVRTQLVAESRTAILNEARVSKVQSMSKDLVFDQDAIKAFAQSAGR